MHAKARDLLKKLLIAGEKSLAGVSSRAPSLTKHVLSEYRQQHSLQEKEAFETTMKAARAASAVRLTWEAFVGESGFIERIELMDVDALARFLGVQSVKDQMELVSKRFYGLEKEFPVLNEVSEQWKRLRTVRALGPDSVDDWVDATKVIRAQLGRTDDSAISLPIREASARLFNQSKRIEALTGPLDVLLTGALDAGVRDSVSVWQELGLFREEHPVRMAGNVTIQRGRVTALLDSPYAAFPAKTIMAVTSDIDRLITIENLTTFHSEAERLCDQETLLIYTGGMPSPAWRAMYERIVRSLSAETSIAHWGDIDEGGFRIAARLSADVRCIGRMLAPWRMHPEAIPEEMRRPASESTRVKMRCYAQQAGWTQIADAVYAAGFTVEQEAM